MMLKHTVISLRIAVTTCIACDIPASRKVCGFLGHNAALGCNKCFKKLSLGHTDYSGFDRENWEHVQLIVKVVGDEDWNGKSRIQVCY